jgi:Biotin carboxylase, N-terminal domain/X-Pro dipeptidyl-peptidase C-terminal non-catalytic domain
VILRRVLIANRGEIAVRVLRTCRRLGIETVLAVPEMDTAADADSVPARLADKTIAIGSYLNVEAVVAAAVAAGADAIHPGYGFLSENPRLARACEAAGVVFIGPSADVLEILPSGTRFEPGETLRLVIQGKDVYRYPRPLIQALHDDLVNRGRHVIHSGGEYDSHLLVPMQVT